MNRRSERSTEIQDMGTGIGEKRAQGQEEHSKDGKQQQTQGNEEERRTTPRDKQQREMRSEMHRASRATQEQQSIRPDEDKTRQTRF